MWIVVLALYLCTNLKKDLIMCWFWYFGAVMGSIASVVGAWSAGDAGMAGCLIWY